MTQVANWHHHQTSSCIRLLPSMTFTNIVRSRRQRVGVVEITFSSISS